MGISWVSHGYLMGISWISHCTSSKPCVKTLLPRDFLVAWINQLQDFLPFSGHIKNLYIMSRSKKYKSPSTVKRSLRRLVGFLKGRMHPPQTLSICNQDSITIPPRATKLNFCSASNINIQPVHCSDSNLIRPRPPRPRPNLQIITTTNTCDTPECYGRKRPCHSGNPRTQFYHDSCYYHFR